MIDITTENFESDVIVASQTTPVLVDFWAPWCGPCKQLMPVLEKLETEYAGRFTLAKINVDDEQQIAGMFGVRSVPTVVLMVNGQPVDGFAGAQPEGQIRALLDKHLPAPEEVAAQQDEDEAQAALQAGDTDTALEKLQHAVATDPANDDARFDYVKLLLELDRLDDAKVAFAPVIAKAASVQRLGSLQQWMDAQDASASGEDIAALDARIATNKRDFEARFARSQRLMAARQWTDAMDELLEILMRDKAWNEGQARKTYIAILDIIEPPAVAVAEGQIPPEDPTVASYRRRLSSVILS
ncbi:thioredoxin [Brachymonas chironomi]|uniref:thioredoxin n=1 Tax=Brachymonas chironomi TaxID=491919 RepID=UPI000364F063|nr:thioredoxin [Brachymonas chironomi]